MYLWNLRWLCRTLLVYIVEISKMCGFPIKSVVSALSPSNVFISMNCLAIFSISELTQQTIFYYNFYKCLLCSQLEKPVFYVSLERLSRLSNDVGVFYGNFKNVQISNKMLYFRSPSSSNIYMLQISVAIISALRLTQQKIFYYMLYRHLLCSQFKT